MNIELLTEEPSMERALSILLPKILGPGHVWKIRSLRGKSQLLGGLQNLLAGYAYWARAGGTKVVVLVDRDDDDCLRLKKFMEDAAKNVGLSTHGNGGEGEEVTVLNRIVVEELESWFLGDADALRTAYPRLPAGLEHQRKFRDPEAVPGGAWEGLQDLLQRHGYFSAGLVKQVVAAEIARHMNVETNRSQSFQAFRDGLRRLVGEEPHA